MKKKISLLKAFSRSKRHDVSGGMTRASSAYTFVVGERNKLIQKFSFFTEDKLGSSENILFSLTVPK